MKESFDFYCQIFLIYFQEIGTFVHPSHFIRVRTSSYLLFAMRICLVAEGNVGSGKFWGFLYFNVWLLFWCTTSAWVGFWINSIWVGRSFFVCFFFILRSSHVPRGQLQEILGFMFCQLSFPRNWWFFRIASLWLDSEMRIHLSIMRFHLIFLRKREKGSVAIMFDVVFSFLLLKIMLQSGVGIDCLPHSHYNFCSLMFFYVSNLFHCSCVKLIVPP